MLSKGRTRADASQPKVLNSEAKPQSIEPLRQPRLRLETAQVCEVKKMIGAPTPDSSVAASGPAHAPFSYPQP